MKTKKAPAIDFEERIRGPLPTPKDARDLRREIGNAHRRRDLSKEEHAHLAALLNEREKELWSKKEGAWNQPVTDIGEQITGKKRRQPK